MVLASKLNRSNYKNRYNSSGRNCKIFSSPNNPDRKREFNHLLSTKLAEAATRMDRKRFMNNKINERDTCKVV